MTDKEILTKLDEIAYHYNHEDWPIYDLLGQLEDLFAEMDRRAGR